MMIITSLSPSLYHDDGFYKLQINEGNKDSHKLLASTPVQNLDEVSSLSYRSIGSRVIYSALCSPEGMTIEDAEFNIPE